MTMVIYDPKPYKHDYVSHKFFVPLLQYASDTGRDLKMVESLNGLKGKTVLAFSGYLTPDVVDHLKGNDNKIISFDINDSTWLSDAYRNTPAVDQLDLIFKFSGIPKIQFSDELQISPTIDYSKHRKYYVDDDEWGRYTQLRDSGKIVPMPHIPWQHFNVEQIPFEEKRRQVLVRGGNHYLRYHLFMNLLKRNLIGNWSGFFMADYHKSNMADSHRFCDWCVETYQKFGRIPYTHYAENHHGSCNNPFMTMGEIDDETFQNANTHRWNNKCIPMYYWLTEQFVKAHGTVDFKMVENAFGAFYLRSADLGEMISHHLYTGDYKWIYSIDIPPRFWEGCAAGTISLYPKWTGNQTHFPELIEGEHYVAYDEAFEDIEDCMGISKEKYEHITNNCLGLYNEWISDPERGISTKLMDRIFDHIEVV